MGSTVTATSEYCLSACALALAIRSREIFAREALEAHFAQIDAINPTINAIVTMDRETAVSLASAADALTATGAELPPLPGVPMTHKDTNNSKGLRTTQGSRVFKNHIPDFDDLIIARFKAGGVVTTGKSNVPEFGAGSHTFNEIFGTTTNPYDPWLSAGGSSGGVAAAIAARIQAVGDGSDMGGSLRIPASFCNVVGFRPSFGVIPVMPSRNVWSWLTRTGPMAREVADVALARSVLAGPDSRLPFPNPVRSGRFTEPIQRGLTGLKIAWSPDFGIGIPVGKEVLHVLEGQLKIFEDLGAIAEEAAPNLSDADQVFNNVRAFDDALGLGDVVVEHGDLIKPEVRWNVAKGFALSSKDWIDTALARSRLETHMQTFFERYDVFASPSAQLLPFDTSLRYPTAIEGVEFENYLDWMRSVCVISATGIPAMSILAGLSESGLPVGMQLAMNHGMDFELLQVGYGFEQAKGFAKRSPELVRLSNCAADA